MTQHLENLHKQLKINAFVSMRPFGPALTLAIQQTRICDDGYAAWEEADFCSPSFTEERKAVLDQVFTDTQTINVNKGEGRSQIEHIPGLLS